MNQEKNNEKQAIGQGGVSAEPEPRWEWQKGNWSVFPKKKYNEWHVAIPTDNGSGMKLALFEDGVPGDTDEEREALARLIAAAADSLAACQALVDVADGRTASNEAYWAAVGLARDAIAKTQPEPTS